jgi:hypothetical protein
MTAEQLLNLLLKAKEEGRDLSYQVSSFDANTDEYYSVLAAEWVEETDVLDEGTLVVIIST